eukprot:TRINITY_DN2947_c0_g1_i3.p1 TRINITY_DN2947_c0_g1~~TRINITY_DN2947_c0_g1_i3.p1  ORF type:complete len:403 (-),score=149.06 TRINITY_DN2947_c0_g1_i3:92-1300(-)
MNACTTFSTTTNTTTTQDLEFQEFIPTTITCTTFSTPSDTTSTTNIQTITPTSSPSTKRPTCSGINTKCTKTKARKKEDASGDTPDRRQGRTRRDTEGHEKERKNNTGQEVNEEKPEMAGKSEGEGKLERLKREKVKKEKKYKEEKDLGEVRIQKSDKTTKSEKETTRDEKKEDNTDHVVTRANKQTEAIEQDKMLGKGEGEGEEKEGEIKKKENHVSLVSEEDERKEEKSVSREKKKEDEEEGEERNASKEEEAEKEEKRPEKSGKGKRDSIGTRKEERKEKSEGHGEVAEFSSPGTTKEEEEADFFLSSSEKPKNCSICWEDSEGLEMVYLSCRHCFCITCLNSMLEMKISEGDVQEIHCPACPTCIQYSEIKKIVSAEVFCKYEKFSLLSCLKADKSTR